MTEWILPMPGTTIGDAGPYAVGGASDPGWWDCWHVMARAGGRLSQTALADIGVFYCVDDQLECTIAADTTSVDVDEGACLVDGAFHWNDTDPVNVPIPAAGAGDERIDVVVVRKNYQAAVTYTPGGGAPTVGPREGRITVIRGTEAAAPVAPSVTQDTTRATYWDVPLCSVQVDDGGTLSNLTDLREYVDAVTKIDFVSVFTGRNTTDGVDLSRGADWQGVETPDAKDSDLTATYVVPEDLAGSMYIETCVVPGSSGDIYSQADAAGPGADGEAYNVTSCGTALSATTVVGGNNSEINRFNVTFAPQAGEYLHIRFNRDGSNVLDTIGDVVYVAGFKIEYLGWRR